MRTIICLAVILVLLGVTGCQVGPKELFVVDFTKDTALRYKLVSERDIELNLGQAETTKSRKKKTQKMTEKLELVISYDPIEVDPYGLSTIKATCESAKITRISFTGKKSSSDAVRSLKGKTFTFQVTPTGQIDDYANLEKLVKELGKKAFTQKRGKQGRVKDPDMILDFVALQWYLWDSVSTIENPLEGAVQDQTWTTQQFIPLPMPIPVARKTTYKLSEIKQSEDGKKAVLTSSYTLGKLPRKEWPKPHSGKFRLKGMFGFLRNYRIISINGSGSQIFNLDAGQIESEQQQYKVKVEAGFLMPLGDSVPELIIDQKINVQLLDK